MKLKNQLVLVIFMITILNVRIDSYSQTPGMIFENLGIEVLDPNSDGFISKTSLGFSIADKFTNQESEIPYVPFAAVQMEPTYDPGPGPNCFFNDFDDIREYGEPLYSYFDQNTSGGPYLLFRFRLSGYAPNSKSYSVFIDIDGKFGDPAVVGATAGDPNFTSSNPGFEIEIYLATNFGVGIYNIDGVHSGTSTDPGNVDAKDGTYPYISYAHKAVAWEYPGGTCTDGQEYFYDFYIPWNAVTALTYSGDTETSIGGPHITTSTSLRMVGATIMNPNPGFNNGLDNASLSDWGGIDDEGTPEQLVTELINVFPPTTVEDIDDNNRIAPRSDCPTINTPIVGSTAISGTSTEDDGTDITVYVADNSNFTSASTYTTTVSSGEWSVTVPALTVDYYVKATAQNSNESYGGVTISESVSYDDCDIEIVINSCDDNKTPAVYNISEIGGRKGFDGNIDNPLGHTMEVAIYDLSDNLVDLGASPLYPNPCVTTTEDWIVQAAVSGGSFTPGIYYIVSRDLTANICPSDYEYICMHNNSGDYRNTASTPTIDGVSPLSASLTSLTGTTSSESNAIVQVYIDGIISEATVTGTDWELSGLSFSGCESIEVAQYITQTGSAECVSSKATAFIDARTASTPSISGSYCGGSNITITGTSSEPDGSIIKIYENALLLDSTTVEDGEWYLFGQTVSDGSTLTAKIPSGTCLNESAFSAGVTVGSKTSNTGLSVDNTVVEGETSVDVTAPSSGGPYTIRLYIDYYNETSWISPALSVAAGNTYTFTGLVDDNANSLIYAGARLTATAEDAANCESDLSAEYEVPCDASVIETTKTVTAESPVCSGNSSVITIENSQKGIMYQVYDAGKNPIGYTAAGNGGNIYVSTGNLTYGGASPSLDPQDFTIKAIRMVPSSIQCIDSLNEGTPVTVNVKEDIGPVNLTVTSTPSPAAICSGGTIDVTVSSSQSSIYYQLFNDDTDDSLSAKVAGDGSDIIITSNPINNSGNIPVRVTASSGTCTANLSTIIGVQLKNSPSITGNFSVCEGVTGEIYSTDTAMTNYSWSVTGGSITAGQNTDTATITWNTAGKQTISVTYDERLCGSTYDVTVNDCSVPNITIDDVSITEGDAGSANLDFTVTISTISGSNVTVEYTTADNTAVAGSDYTATNGIATVIAGNTTTIVSIPILGDLIFEDDETFYVNLSNASGGTITDAQGIGTITDNESANASLSVTTHGNESGPVNIVFTVTLDATNNTGSAITFDFDDLSTGTATSGSDYTAIAAAAQISVADGATTGTITVVILDDGDFEGTETLDAQISNPSDAGVSITTASATANITDDEAVNASLSVTTHGNESGPVNIVFTVTLDVTNNTGSAITFDFDDLGTGTATSGSDYAAIAGAAQISVADGATTGTITVVVLDDGDFEGTETIDAQISNPSNAGVSITTASATANITDDEAVNASLSVTTHGNESGPVNIVYTVTLDATNNTGSAITFDFDDLGTGTATSGSDYTAISGSAQISVADGATTGTITVPILDDGDFEGTETIDAQISNPSDAGVSITTSSATANITDDEALNASLSVTTHGNESGPVNIVYTVTLDSTNNTGSAITFDFDDLGTGTATSGSDYTAIAGAAQISVADGATTGTITVVVLDDGDFEGIETIDAQISNPSDASVSITTASATANITDDEAVNASLSVTTHGNESGPVNIVFTVTLDATNNTGSAITFDFDDLGTGTATSGSDYTAIAGAAQISVADGATTGTITVVVLNDGDFEGTETTDAQISNPSDPGVSVTTASATANISDDEAINASLNVTIHGNESGPVNIVYTVTLDATNNTGSAITFDFDDLSTGTATSGSDYTAIAGAAQISVADGATTGTITVVVLDDGDFEGTETIDAQISNPSDAGVSITTASSSANITDNEVAPVNQAPTATDDNATITEGNIALGNLLTNDSDPDGNNLVINTTPVTNATNGVVVINTDGTYTYTPNTGFTGIDSFVYEVCDDGTPSECSTATVTITVNAAPPVNQSPIAVDDSATINEGGTATGNLLTNDSDPDGDNLVINTTPATNATNGVVVINTDGTYTYTPNTGFTGTDSFVYEVCDDGTPSECSTATVTIVIGMDHQLFIPQGFSPNNDGDNDYFVIPGIEQYNHVSIIIFNRWGNIVFEKDNYENEWDGTSNVSLSIGSELPTGTYFYQIVIHDTNKRLTGYVYLNR